MHSTINPGHTKVSQPSEPLDTFEGYSQNKISQHVREMYVPSIIVIGLFLFCMLTSILTLI